MSAPGPPGTPHEITINRGTVLAPATEFPYGWIQRWSTTLLRWIGWKVVGDLPSARKSVFIVAPHTSNWDMPIGLCAGYASGILRRWPYGFMMKDVMFRGPLGPLMRWIGGLAIDRSSPHDVVQQMVHVFEARDDFVLAITPEGTRSRRPHWKSGFYHIALGAGVPIVPVAFDYRRKEVGLGTPMTPTGDPDADLGTLRRFFQDVTPKRPENFGPIRFRPEG
jgi:1-acyl-sn-glycerol-3-phosphate acyltransferase